MGLFSERYGYTKPSDVIIREQITPEIESAIFTNAMGYGTFNWITPAELLMLQM